MTALLFASMLIFSPGLSPGLGPGPSGGLGPGLGPGPSGGLSPGLGPELSSGLSPGLSPQNVAEIAWLEGHWIGTDGPMQMEEIWTSAAGGALLGLHKDVVTRTGAARMVSFEFLRIEAGADGIAYVAQPGGRPPTRFALVESGPRRVVFANPAHDFPQRILYWLDDAGALHARIEGPKDGKTVSQEWTWTRRPAK